MKRNWIIILLIFTLVGIGNPLTTRHSFAKASNDAMKILKGTWHTYSEPGMVVKFTKKWCKYYTNDNELVYKWKIVSTEKKSYGYLIKLKHGKKKISFHTSEFSSDTLDYFGSWKGKDSYSGSSSLTRISGNTDVTSEMKDDENLKSLIIGISNYTCSMLANAASKEKNIIELSNNTMASIAMYISCVIDSKYMINKTELQNAIYNLFGKKANLSTIPRESTNNHMCIYYDKSLKKYMYNGGDWGDYSPKVSIKKIEKVKKGIYNVVFSNKLSLELENKTKILGITKIKIKEDSRSIYNYVIERLQYKGNGNSFF